MKCSAPVAVVTVPDAFVYIDGKAFVALVLALVVTVRAEGFYIASLLGKGDFNPEVCKLFHFEFF